MKNIRQSTFETNSSSVHSLIVSCKNKDNWKINDMLLDNNGVIHVKCDDFSYTGYVCGQYEKLKYLCSYLACDRQYNSTDDFSADNDWQLKNVLDAIRKYDDRVQNIVVTDTVCAEFDHQTHPSNASCCVNLYSDEAIASFLFNDDIMIEMGRD